MGQQKSSQALQDQQINFNHPHFRNKRVQLVNQHVIVTKTISKRQYQDWEIYLKGAPSDHEYLLMPQRVELKPVKQYCCGSQTGYLQITFQEFSQILQKEINDRAQKMRQFQQSELWYILYSLTKGASVFHERKEKCGDIRPMNIFIRGNGQIKLFNHFSWPEHLKTNYEKTFNQNEITYLSPQEMNQLSQSNRGYPKSDQILSQSFSVGLTCLDCVLLTNSTDLYYQRVFNYNRFQERLQRLKQKTNYSQGLIYLVTNLCHVSSKQRLKCSEVAQMLGPYEESILNMQYFQLPYKIYQPYQPHSARKRDLDTPKKILQATYRNDDSISPRDSLNKSREERRKSKRYSYQDKYLESIQETEKKVYRNIKQSNKKYY